MADQTKKHSRPFRHFKRRIVRAAFNLLGPPLIGGLCNLLAHSLRLRFQGFEHFEQARRSGRPVILVFWHEDLLGAFLTYLRLRLGRIGVMLSPSRDGDMASRIVQRYGLTPIRASSTRGAVRGFMEFYRWLTRPGQGSPLGLIALDGPRGPRRQAKAGAAMLARKAGALVQPVAYNFSRKTVLRSWDRHLLPKPFAAAHIHLGAPLDAAQWPDDNAANTRLMSETLNKLKEQAGLP